MQSRARTSGRRESGGSGTLPEQDRSYVARRPRAARKHARPPRVSEKNARGAIPLAGRSAGFLHAPERRVFPGASACAQERAGTPSTLPAKSQPRSRPSPSHQAEPSATLSPGSCRARRTHAIPKEEASSASEDLGRTLTASAAAVHAAHPGTSHRHARTTRRVCADRWPGRCEPHRGEPHLR
jgi:hypothetical protein